MSDLDELLARAWREREDAERASGVGPVLAPLTLRVRRRRVRRHALQVVAALPVAAGLAWGGWSLAGHLPSHVPVVTQSPDPAPSEITPTPTPTPTATGAVEAPDPMTTTLGLPAGIQPLPEGLLESTGPGWVLGLYEPEESTDRAARPLSQVVVLGYPGGPTYEVTRLDARVHEADGDLWQYLVLDHWTPGTTSALVSLVPLGFTGGDGSTFPLYDLDLRTGELTRSDQDLGEAQVWSRVAAVVEGRVVWLEQDGEGRGALLRDGQRLGLPLAWTSGPFQVSPDERFLLAGDGTVVDLDAFRVLGALPAVDGEACAPVSWWTADELVAACRDDASGQVWVPPAAARPRLEVFRVADLAAGAGTVLRELAAGDPWPTAGAYLGDHQVLVPSWVAIGWSADDGPATDRLPVRLTDAGFDPAPLPDGRDGATVRDAGAGAGWAYLLSSPDSTTMEPSVLGAVRAEADGSFVSAPVFGPPAGGTPGGGSWQAGLTSWVVGR